MTSEFDRRAAFRARCWFVGLAMSGVGAAAGALAAEATVGWANAAPSATSIALDEMTYKPRQSPRRAEDAAPQGASLPAIAFRPTPAPRDLPGLDVAAANEAPGADVRPSRAMLRVAVEPANDDRKRDAPTPFSGGAFMASAAPVAPSAPRPASTTDVLLKWMGATELGATSAEAALRSVPDPNRIDPALHPTVTYAALGLSQNLAAGDRDAALGLALATPLGCERILDGPLRIAAGDAWRRAELEKVCLSFAETLRAQLGAPPETVATAAGDAWRFLRDLAMSLCSPTEREMMSIEMAALHFAIEQRSNQ